MKTITYRLNESVNKQILVEGLNFEQVGNIIRITLTDAHNKGVDFTTINNPTYWTYNKNNKKYQGISIFRRTIHRLPLTNDKVDGNPLLYAMKGVSTYKIDITNSDIIKYIRRFRDVCSNIKSSYDTLILTPSNNELNMQFMKALKSSIDVSDSISDIFVKKSARDIFSDEDIMNIEEYVYTHFTTITDWQRNDICNRTKIGITKMFKNGNKFSMKELPIEMRPWVTSFITLNQTKNIYECSKLIDDKDIVILDDTWSTGTTVSYSIDELLKTFSPKSVTIITLFSPVKIK